MPVHVDVYEPDGVTFVRRLTQSWARSWSIELGEGGAGQVMVQAGTADAAALTHRRVVKVVDQDTARVLHAWLVMGEQARVLDIAGEHGQTVQARGVGVRHWLRDGLVYHVLELGRQAGKDRPLNWAGASLDRSSGWISPYVVKDLDSEDDDPPYELAPAGFPRGFGAQWIAARAPVPSDSETPPQRVGDEYFFAEFEVDGQSDCSVFWSADDGVEIWIDDRLLSKETEAFLWMSTKDPSLVLDAGWHHIAVKHTNIERQSVATNGAAFILSIHKMENGGADVGDLILTTNDVDWVVAEVPEPAPTMTPGEILDLLMSEAQARGCFPQIAWGFTGELDSQGAPWAVPVDLVASVGREIDLVAGMLSEVAVEISIDPDTCELVAVNKGSMGQDLSATVQLMPTTSVAGMSSTGEGPSANAPLVYYGTGIYAAFEHDQSISKYGRIEGSAEIGTADSVDQVERLMAEWLAEYAGSAWDEAIEVEAVPGATPGVDFSVGDVVSIPARNGGSVAVRVHGIDVTEVDPSADGRQGGTQRYVVRVARREVWS